MACWMGKLSQKVYMLFWYVIFTNIEWVYPFFGQEGQVFDEG
jgi:hypothetical protein